MDLTIDDDLHLRTRDGERLTVNIPDLTCNVEVKDGRVYVTHLWIGGRPFPQRGGTNDPFETELASRIIYAISCDWVHVIKRKWSEQRDDQPREVGYYKQYTGA